MKLLEPYIEFLAKYSAALKRGWPPTIFVQKSRKSNWTLFLTTQTASLQGLTIGKPKDHRLFFQMGRRSLPLGFRRWILKDGFCGSIGMRWQPGTEALPPHCSGHVGAPVMSDYAVVPWRRNEGTASAALPAFLPEARKTGLHYIELTADPENAASVRVIEKAGGVFVERFHKDASLGGGEALRFHISFTSKTSPDCG